MHLARLQKDRWVKHKAEVVGAYKSRSNCFRTLASACASTPNRALYYDTFTTTSKSHSIAFEFNIHGMEPPSETSSTASSQPTISAPRGLTLAKWEEYREQFIQLYVVEGKSLPEVRTQMASLYGFHAT
jgi:hypothetical protein